MSIERFAIDLANWQADALRFGLFEAGPRPERCDYS